MFKFLKDKLKGALGKLTKDVSKDAKVEEIEERIPAKEIIQKKPAPQKPVEKPKPAKKEPEKKVEKSVPKSIPKKSEPQVRKQEPVKEAKKPELVKVEQVVKKIEPVKTEEKKPIEVKAHEIKEPPKKVHEEKRGFLGKIFGKREQEKKRVEPREVEKPAKVKVQPEAIVPKEAPVHDEPVEPEPRVIQPEGRVEKKGLFGFIKQKVTTIQLSDERFNEIFWELELALLENNVAVEVIEKIKLDLKDELTSGRVQRKSVEEVIHDRLQKSIEELFVDTHIDLLKEAKKKKPYIIAFIGVNGSGKTTALAKLAHLFQEKGMSVVVAASDTFRAAAIQQLEEHCNKLGVKMIKHDYGSDPAAVAFDAISHAKAKNVDVVLIDTAGRLHSNDNLMQELKKLIKVNNPDFKMFVGEAITGNDCVEQAKVFDEAVGIDGIILAKADVDEKGGAAVSVSYVTKKPILFLGTGQGYDDLAPFKKELILENLGL
ncbi:MAG: signal recognition particle-docking protein FtsY [Candidatus Woesearchaeota archaeon]